MHNRRPGPVKYQQLPNNQRIKLFLNSVCQPFAGTPTNIKSSFLHAKDLNEAYLFVVFCFGDMEILDLLPNYVFQNKRQELKAFLQTFNWQKNAATLTLFAKNAEILSSNFEQFKKQVIEKLSQSKSKKIFKKVIRSHLLNGVKIRKWKFGSYRQIKRQFEQAQNNRIDGTKYLLISKDKDCAYSVGVISFSRSSIVSVQTNPYSREQSTSRKASLLDKTSSYNTNSKQLDLIPKTNQKNNQPATKTPAQKKIVQDQQFCCCSKCQIF